MTESTVGSPLRTATGRQGFLFGLLAGVAMVFFTVAIRLLGDTLSITELAADRFTELLPSAVLDFLLETLTFSAKPLMFAGILIAQVLLGGALGALYVRMVSRWPSSESGELLRSIGFGVILWFLSMLALVPWFGGGVFGTGVPGDPTWFILASLGAFVVYGWSLGLLLSWVTHGGLHRATRAGRRAFLKRVTVWAVVGVVVGYGLKWVFDQLRAQVTYSGSFRTQGVLSTEITPNEEFYVVSKNIIDPYVNEPGWSIEVTGLVHQPLVLTYDELTAMPSVEKVVTLECISNWVGGDLISNALWRGVPLRSILQEAELKPGVVDISFRASDGYSESIPLSMAMSDDVLVVFEMNGVPLSADHGFPARLIVPGFYGLKSVKWLTAVEPVDYDFKGFWQERGWIDVPYVKTFSRFDIPATDAVVQEGSVTLGGVAFAGDRGISNIEVSADDGLSWTPVDEISAPLSPYTWVIWTKEFVPAARGPHVVRVRATDGDGMVQTSRRKGTVPDGATGHHELPFSFG